MITGSLRKLAATLALGMAAFTFIAPVAALAQEAPAAAAPAAGAAPAAAAAKDAGHGKNKTLIDTYNEGGWVMHIIAVTSVLLVWLTVDGFIKTTAKKVYPSDQVAQLRELFRAGD